MQIVEGLHVKACWEVCCLKPPRNLYKGAMAVFEFSVMVNGEYRFQGTAFDNDEVVLECLTSDGINIPLGPTEDHPVIRDLEELGYKRPYKNYIKFFEGL